MPTNFYFNNFPLNQITSEQLLVEDLVIEAMQIHGMDIYYLPRSIRENNEIDYLYGEDTLKQYTKAYSIEMYLEDVMGMEGEGDFISKFGLEIRDEITFLVSRRRFKYTTKMDRPLEGDLVFVPLLNNFFEVTFVEHENNQAMFYTLGRGRGGNVYVYALKLKQFVFSNEVVNTGVELVDEQIRENYAKTRINLVNGSGYYANGEIVYQGSSLANSTAQAVVYHFVNKGNTKFVDIVRVNGDFVSGNVIGTESGAIYTANVTTMLAADFLTMDDPHEDIMDNNRLEQESSQILDWSEQNPFGET